MRPNRSQDGRDNHKAQQLCAQVREVLGLVLADQWDNPTLELVSVVAVTPAPDTSRLLVTVTVDSDEGPVDAAQVLQALKSIRGRLRREVAAEINRKKTPELVFDLAPLGSEVLT